MQNDPETNDPETNDPETIQYSNRGYSSIILGIGIVITLFAAASIYVPYFLSRRDYQIADFVHFSVGATPTSEPTETPTPTSTFILAPMATATTTATATITPTVEAIIEFNYPSLVPYVSQEGYLSQGQSQTFEFKSIFGVPLEFEIDVPAELFYELSISNSSDSQFLLQQITGPVTFEFSPIRTDSYQFKIVSLAGEGPYGILAKFAETIGTEGSAIDSALFLISPVDTQTTESIGFTWKPIPRALHRVVAQHVASTETFESEWLEDYNWNLEVPKELVGAWQWHVVTNSGAQSGTANFIVDPDSEAATITPTAGDQESGGQGKTADPPPIIGTRKVIPEQPPIPSKTPQPSSDGAQRDIIRSGSSVALTLTEN